MKKEQLLTTAVMCVLALAACAPAETGEAEAEGDMGAAEDAAASTSTLQSEMLADLAQVRDKYVQLAEAVPESDYGWRPAEGVRSVSEVYMHVVAGQLRDRDGHSADSPAPNRPTRHGTTSQTRNRSATRRPSSRHSALRSTMSPKQSKAPPTTDCRKR